MSVDEFIRGYLDAIVKRTPLPGRPESVLHDRARGVLLGGVPQVWADLGADIEAAPGVPGLRVSKAWHAGREFAMLRLRFKASADPADFGQALADTLRDRALALRPVRLVVRGKNVMAEEHDG